ncbi:hypothetical protein Agub_g2124 [Astrephomene gubernaculifera]|uniref:Uncharacterized protein n=1 Tax=Astrephomene gubernaculifera TaxID=47775 RepID=A0AAD3HHV4_9CHLO|nr:hypothetical protein Agub_g2124 [Astrephomene gubernaculifera]
MTWTMTPDSYDVVVIGSGLPECLVAASLVKSGKSVLIIDAVDTYGTDFASFTPAALQNALNEQAKQKTGDEGAPCATAASSASGANDAQNPHLPQQPNSANDGAQEHEHSLPACSPLSEPLPPGCRLLRLRQRPLPLSGLRAFAVAGEEGGGPADRRGYILDLVPKLVYQSEPLVDLLVRCRCHHYLEFKAVEGSYVLQDGALQPVPAGRADIFRDRRLGLADKRLLMRFIAGCVEARSGQGHLKDALSSASPLAAVLAAEGLPARLREVILYGIAMADTDQEPPPPPSSSATATATPSTDIQPVNGDGDVSSSPSTSPPALPPSLMTGAEGGAALELFTSSQGRFGQAGGAFMVPSYGWGSVAEAFVRLCAVHGAVTVLRQPVQGLVLAEGEAAAEVMSTAVAVEGEGRGGEAGDGKGSSEGSSRDGGSSGGGSRCVGIVTAAGQLVRCGTVVAGAGTLRCLEGAASPSLEGPSRELVSRAVVVLDSSLISQPQTHQQPQPTHGSSQSGIAAQSLLTVVVPPRSPGCGSGGGGHLGNPHPVRALQTGASTCVCPQGRFLLYLSTPATSPSASAHDDLCPCLAALTDTSGLRDLATAPTAPTATATTTTTSPSGLQDATTSSSATEAATTDATAAGPAASCRPRALRAWFYRQPVLHRCGVAAAATAAGSAGAGAGPEATAAGTAAAATTGACVEEAGGLVTRRSGGGLPGGVVLLPGPDGSLAGYGEVLRTTEAAFRSAFPGVAWLSEVNFAPAGAAGGSGGEGEGGGAEGALERGEEDDAIDELSAALAKLKDA